MLSKEVLKLAKERGINCDTTGKFWLMREDALEAFYKAAYNKAIEDAAELVATDKFGIGSMLSQWTSEEVAEEIRELELK